MAPVANDETSSRAMSGDPPVKTECLPFARIPHTSRLFLDFLSCSPRVQPFYPRSARFSEWFRQEAVVQPYDADRRQRVSEALERQNRQWGVSGKTLTSIARLRTGASVVVTGQQVGLFGGPLFSFLKALTAVKFAEDATAAGIDTVPVFWLATTDHDLAEVNHAAIPGADAALHTIAIPSHGVEDAPVGMVTFGAEIDAAVQSAVDLLGATAATELLGDSYRQGETLGSSFARMFARLFAEWGVVLMDPSDAVLHAEAKPIYHRAIAQAAALDEALLARGRELEDAGYHQQVKVTPSSTLLFTLRGGTRVPIHRRTNGHNEVEFLIQEEKVSRQQLLDRIAAAPQDFSPNVLLRPVVQDYLLPTLAYTGGSAEVAYFAQAGVVYEKLLGHVTPIVPRFSATIVEAKPKALLDRYGLELPDTFHGEEVLKEKLAGRMLPPELQQAFDSAGTDLKKSLARIRDGLVQLDKTLVDAADNAGSKMQHQLETLRARAARAELRQSELAGRHAQQLSTWLFPGKALQERGIAAIYFLARLGPDLLTTLYANLHTDCQDHQVITLN
jgi:bacillithiol biosynthesis cysteine-adding enzyme BshC